MQASKVAVFSMVLVLLVCGAQFSESATCTPTALSPCMSAISSGTPPSKLCCSKIKEQQPCLCQYLKDPNLRKFVNSPNAKKIASTCGVPQPKCK
ncbi:non-specific lipid-transfer protein 2-like [Olea europaea var. sylvestris]|uniref:non-specific lipid-transfer protein 2-like n=1 Tax=Olea europaea var. sylvestris TaxID=158386 RepID=UPI000C1CE05E|nr:non-specific lipid-transfer protein 2-like [Olea europaea var. sylvestris]